MQINLAPQLMGQQAAFLVQHGHGAFIAGGLYGQHSHP